MGFEQENIRNSLGLFTDFEDEHPRNFVRHTTGDRVGSDHAIILRAHSVFSYDIRLISEDTEINYVGTINTPQTPFSVGKEVLLAYPQGLRQAPMIWGAVYYPIPADGFQGGYESPSGVSTQMAFKMATIDRILQTSALVLNEDSTRLTGTGVSYLNYLPAAILHQDSHLAEPVKTPVLRITGDTLITNLDEHIQAYTNGGVITVTLPAGIPGTHYHITNIGDVLNDVIIVPDGTELLNGANLGLAIHDSESLDIYYESTGGWWF